MLKNSKCWSFLSCLEFAVRSSFFNQIIFKPKQVICLESIFLQRDTLAVLPTGYGKSLIFFLLPALLCARKNGFSISKITSIVIVVSPLNALIKDHINRLNSLGIEAAAVGMKCSTSTREAGDQDSISSDPEDEQEDTHVACDFQFSDKEKLEKGQYNIVFAHPEFLVSSKYGRKMMQSKPYQDNVCAVVIDEAHCILEW
jgi:ATP-dependent DNA helicase RecQ